MSPRRGLRRLFMSTTEAIDKAWGWHRLPLPLALAVLEGIRMRMRQKNLYDPATTAYDREMDPADGGWHLQRSARPGDGERRDAVWPERAALANLSPSGR